MQRTEIQTSQIIYHLMGIPKNFINLNKVNDTRGFINFREKMDKNENSSYYRCYWARWAYLAKFLLKKVTMYLGGVRKLSKGGINRLQTLGVQEKVNFIKTLILIMSLRHSVIQNHQFNEVYNLAAQSSVGQVGN